MYRAETSSPTPVRRVRSPRARSATVSAALFAVAAVVATPAPSVAQGFGAVFTQTNAASDNELAVALRLPFGYLLPLGGFATGGDGTGGGLGSQGALALDAGDRHLLAVNAGSDEITLFRLWFGVLPQRLDVEPSRGDRPTSVAVHGDLVYVLNAGSDEIAGFRLRRGGLDPIPGAVHALSPGAMAAQVGFDPTGRFVVVTERATDTIDVFAVQRDGTLGPRTAFPSAGATPFGFLFSQRGVLVVSEAAGGMPNASTTSTYRLRNDGTLVPLTSALATDQSAACWIAIPRGGDFAYTTNTGSASLTGYSLFGPGFLARLDASGRTGELATGGAPIDAEFDRSGRLLYVLDSGNDEVVAFARRRDGQLVRLPWVMATPDGAAGLLAR